MRSLRFADIETRPTEVLDLTSLTVDEFQRLVPAFESAFQAHMAEWCLDAQPRKQRQASTTTRAACGRPVAAIWLWKSARGSITFAYASHPGNR
jgi:hypothetical protein